ncbi:MAG: mechanosensitive ion channel [bacterium]|nr:mechanosensitive ion channel [bacterium]
MTWINDSLTWLNQNPTIKQVLIIIALLLGSLISYLLTKRYILKWLGMLVKKSKTRLDDIIFDKVMSRRLAYVAPILVIYNFAYLTPGLAVTIERLCFALIFLIVLTGFTAFLRAVNEIYEEKKQFKGRPIKGYIQAISIVIYIIGGLVTVGILSGQSILALLSGIGALTAVLLFVFRDTILSFIASLQITTNDLVRIDDWIEVPAFGVDGDVMDIALHTIKIQNFDKTVIVIPTHKLIDVSFKNWRGMRESGGRRIKRSILLDVGSIKFCDDRMVEKLKKIHLLKDYLEQKNTELEEDNRGQNIDMDHMVNGRRLTNVGTFRAYVDAYLRNHQKINHDLTFMIRPRPPGPTGLPIEIYVFVNDVRWTYYEAIQADIFDHILAVVNEFELKMFQYPSGKDFEKIETAT